MYSFLFFQTKNNWLTPTNRNSIILFTKMGFLTVQNEGLSWDESIEHQDNVKNYGIQQAINLYLKFKDLNLKSWELKWGEELEYEVVTMDEKDKIFKIHAEGYQIVSNALQERKDYDGFVFQPEFASWMIEAVPEKAYKLYDWNSSFNALNSLVYKLICDNWYKFNRIICWL